MSNKKISELVAAEATLSGIVPVSDASGTVTNKVTIQSILSSQTLWNIFLPPAPTNLNGVAGNGQVGLTWSAPSVLSQTPVTNYLIQYSSNNGSSWTNFNNGVSTNTSATVTGLTNNTSYIFRVASVNVIGQGDWSISSNSITPIEGDPYWDNVSLLLHFNGSFSDSSKHNHSVQYGSQSYISSDQSRFGGQSAFFAGSSLQISNSSAFGLAEDDFTVECWVYPTSQTLVGGIINFGTYNDGILWRHGSNSDSFYLNGSGANWNAPTNAPLGQWTHLALVRNGSLVSIYANGVSVYSQSFTGDLNASNAVIIGVGAHNFNEHYSGYIDELRITKGIARYTTNFTPPSVAFLDN